MTKKNAKKKAARDRQNALGGKYQHHLRQVQKCLRCDGCGKIADSKDGEPWTNWTTLPVQSAIAVAAGIVKPITCPDCNGTGGKP